MLAIASIEIESGMRSLLTMAYLLTGSRANDGWRYGERRPEALRLATGSKRRAHVLGEGLRLLPCREMRPFGVELVLDEVGIGPARPAFRRLVDLLGEGAHTHRERDPTRREEFASTRPIEPCRRHRRVGQPVERDIVEDVVARQALLSAVEDAGDQLVAADIVVDHPRGEADR